ncbi:translation initiation factor eIF-2B subunit delta-like [Sarcoptes scabiei]|nr:translation initiation factor eIF-2B subunit delta-like [Sarcoptes scabiei]
MKNFTIQLKNSTQYANITSIEFIELIIARVFYMSIGMGLSINGHHTFCGDYIFSGHTVILVLTYMVQHEYLFPSKRRTLVWKCIDLLQIAMTLISVLCILIARGHYFIDIIIAYFITTRTFWIYHTLCSLNCNWIKTPYNHLNRVWWWSVFVYVENINLIPNKSPNSSFIGNSGHYTSHGDENDHHGKCEDPSRCRHNHHHLHHSQYVQRVFEWPLPWPKKFSTSSRHHRSHHQFDP